MKRLKSVEALNLRNPRKWRRSHFLAAVAAVYLLFIAVKSRRFLQAADGGSDGLDRPLFNSAYHETLNRKLASDDSPPRPFNDPVVVRARSSYGRLTGEVMRRLNRPFAWSGNLTGLEAMARDAWNLGAKAWQELENYRVNETVGVGNLQDESKMESCPASVTFDEKNGRKLGLETEKMMLLPCGLEVGSSITVIGMPKNAHREFMPQLPRRGRGDGSVMVSQFMVELQGLKVVDGEDPPKILHFNPRLKGDWSKMPVIELNTCYRMQWGTSMRCDGLPSEDDGDTGLSLFKTVSDFNSL